MPALADLEGLARCRSERELSAATRALIRALGYGQYAFHLEVDGCGPEPLRATLAHALEVARIREALGHHVRERRVVPVVWTEDGDRCITAFVHGGRCEASMLGVIAPGAAAKDAGADAAQVQLLACYLHDAVKRVVLGSKLPREVVLTPRERECLAWAAEGKTAGEIGGILLVAERTVTFHLGNAVRKLGASSRQHAVARAVTLGLVAR